MKNGDTGIFPVSYSLKLLDPSKGITYFRKYGRDEKVSAIVSKIVVVQLRKSGTVLQPRRISSSPTLHRLSRIGKQYVCMYVCMYVLSSHIAEYGSTG